MTWDVYCAVLPSGWSVSVEGGGYDQSAGGIIRMSYEGPDGAKLHVDEGAFCHSDAATCSFGTVVGPASFGDLSGSLKTLPDGSLALYVNPGTDASYTLTGSDLSQNEFVALAAAFAKVAKA